MIKKITENAWFYFFCLKLFVLNFFPVVTEPLAAISILYGSILSPWSLIALAYMMIMMEVDIFILSRPFHSASRSWILKLFEKLAPYLPLDIHIMNLALRNAFNVLKEGYGKAKEAFITKKTKRKSWYKKVKRIGAYCGMMFVAFIPSLGRISHGMYARKKRQLVFGRPLLYAACFVRYYLLFTLLKLGKTIFDLI